MPSTVCSILIPFHEKAGMSQECFSLSVFSFLPVDSLHSSRAASVAILPSALFLSDFRSVHGGRSQFSRSCYLIIDLGSRLSTEAGPGVRRSHLISAVELDSSQANPMLLRSPLGGCSAVAHTPLRSPTTCAAVRLTSEPPQPRLASWRSFLLARRASVPSAADHCLVQTARECSVRLAPSASLNRRHLPC